MADNSNCQDGRESNGEISPKEEAEDLKNQANNLFKGIIEIQSVLVVVGVWIGVVSCDFFFALEGKYEDAIASYSMAIELNPSVPAYFGNRSFCYLKTEYYGLALADANKAIQLDKKYIKVSKLKLIHV